MARIRKRRGKWVVDWRDAHSRRRWEAFPTKEEADRRLGEVLGEDRQKVRPAVDPNITLESYAARWLDTIAVTVKPRTLESYTKTLRLHILPDLGRLKVRQLSRAAIRDLLTAKLRPAPLTPQEAERKGLSRNSVRIIQATLRALLNEAIEDGLIRVNPAAKLGRRMKLVQSATTRQEEIKAMNREQLDRFLRAAATDPAARRYAPLFLTLARTGMRLGEGLALQWQDVDFGAREIRVARAFSAGRIETPKSGHGRTVDMSRHLADALTWLQVERGAEVVERAWSEPPSWVFVTEAGTPLDEARSARCSPAS